MNSIFYSPACAALIALAACGGSEPVNPGPPAGGAPAPVLLSISPGLVDARPDTITLVVQGHDFQATSQVQWNDEGLTTTFVDSTTLTTVLEADRFAQGIVAITVKTPAPGGGTSSPLDFTIAAFAPELYGLSRSGASVAEAGVLIRATGARFTESSVLLWGDSALSTTRVSSTELTATLPATLLSFDTTMSIRVRTPPPGGGTSFSLSFTIVPDLRIRTYDAVGMAYSKARGTLYLSTTPTSESFPNTLLAFSPGSGEMTRVYLEGVLPGKLAISPDQSTLYVELGPNGDVGIIDLNGVLPMKTFSLGSDPDFGVHRVDNMAVIPGAPRSVVIARKFMNLSPRHAGVAVFDDGVERAMATPRHLGPTALAFGDSPDQVYGIGVESGEGSLYTIGISAAGAVITGVKPGLLWGDELAYAAGRLYAPSGDIVDVATLSHVGSFGPPPDEMAGFTVDAANGRAFYYRTNGTLQAYDLSTQQPLRSFDIPDFAFQAACQPLMRWGSNGLVLHCRSALYLLRSGIVTH